MIAQEFELFCQQNKINMEKLRRRNRAPEAVEQRRLVARKLRDKGYTYSEIGDVMHKDHTAIMYMVDEQHREEKKFKMREYQRLRKVSR